MDDYLSLVAQEFAARSAQIRRVVKTHGPSVGMGHEVLLRSFLRAYLPNWVTVGHGMIRDHHGSISGQIDVLIFNSVQYAPLYRVDDFVVVTPESVVATIEVKTTIVKRDFIRSMHQLARSKSLASNALAAMFVFHAPSSATMRRHIEACELQKIDAATIPDLICGLGKYYLERGDVVLKGDPDLKDCEGVGFLRFDHAQTNYDKNSTFRAFFMRLYSHVETAINRDIKEGIDDIWVVAPDQISGKPALIAETPGRSRFYGGLNKIELHTIVKRYRDSGSARSPKPET